MKPLCIALFAGLHGWEEGFVAAGWRCVGFDIVDMCAALGVPRPPDTELVLQDVLTLHGSQFRNAACIVASPPCTEYSYMAMPWRRAKQIAAALRGLGDFPEKYTGSRTLAELNALFNACFRIQREAWEAAGRHIPLVIENVKGAQPWVGQAKANFGSYYLWGDVASVGGRIVAGRVGFDVPMLKTGRSTTKVPGLNFHEHEKTGRPGRLFQSAAVEANGVKVPLSGRAWFADGLGKVSSKSDSRKAASAMIAKIPYDLAVHIARCFHPDRMAGVA